MMYTRRQTIIYSTTGVLFTYGSGMNFQNNNLFYRNALLWNLCLVCFTDYNAECNWQKQTRKVYATHMWGKLCKVDGKCKCNAVFIYETKHTGGSVPFKPNYQNLSYFQLFVIWTKLFLALKLFYILRYFIENLLHYLQPKYSEFLQN